MSWNCTATIRWIIIFQYEPKSWSGKKVDIYGQCDVEYALDSNMLSIHKENCQKSESKGQHNFTENISETDNVS